MERSTPDDELVQRWRCGDGAAFGALYRRYVGFVYTICYGMTDSVDDAHDLCQEAFLNAYRGRTGFQGRSAFRTWLRTITVRVCLRHAERVRRGASLAEPTFVDRAPARLRPDRQVERRETETRLWRAIRSLPPDDRAVLLLREIEDMRYDEIAEALDWSPEKVTTRLHRARAKLATHVRRLTADTGRSEEGPR